jgi:hypothetical protein
MRKGAVFAAAALAGLAATAHAGGQQIAAEVRPDGQSLVVRTYRCGLPASLALTGSAHGLVGGDRRTIPLKIHRDSEPGAFTVARQWPAEGSWVLTFAVAGGRSAAVELAPGPGLRIVSQESVYDAPSPRRIEAALQARR